MGIAIFFAFAAGVLGSALGAMQIVVVTGVFACVTCASAACGSPFDFLTGMTLSPLLSPVVSFGSACAATSYAYWRGYIKESQDIFCALISLKKADVLIAGGMFGIASYLLNTGLNSVFGNAMDTGGLTIVIITLCAKVLCGRDGVRGAVGRVPEGLNRFSVTNSNSWIPYQSANAGFNPWILGMVVGGLAGYFADSFLTLSEQTGNAGLAQVAGIPMWGIALFTCAFMGSGKDIPIYHHIALCGGYAATTAYAAGARGASLLLWGAAVGVITTYIADYGAKIFQVYGDGYVDPPSMGIAGGSFVAFTILKLMGLYRSDVAAIVMLAAFAAMAGYQQHKINIVKTKTA